MPSPTERVFAPAKINLFLHVGDRGANGYHALESLVVFTEIGDALTFAEADAFTLAIDGPFGKGLEADDTNLVLRAARALAAHSGRSGGVAITLTKNLPVASGIGGGSADAAAALRGLARVWSIDIDRTGLRNIAETLGSDVPVCVESRSAWMEGRGERVTPAPGVPAAALVLINPGVALPTASVFGALKTRRGTGTVDHRLHAKDAEALSVFLHATTNDLEAPARAIAPAIGDVLSELSRMPGILLARMSGSGATCFGLFEDDGMAAMAAIALSHSHPAWWVQATRISDR